MPNQSPSETLTIADLPATADKTWMGAVDPTNPLADPCCAYPCTEVGSEAMVTISGGWLLSMCQPHALAAADHVGAPRA